MEINEKMIQKNKIEQEKERKKGQKKEIFF